MKGLKKEKVIKAVINEDNLDYVLPKLVYDLESMFPEEGLNEIYVEKNFSLKTDYNPYDGKLNYCVEFRCKVHEET